MPVERYASGGPYEDVVGYSRVVVTHGPGGRTGVTAGTTALVNGVVQHPEDAYAQALVAFQSALFALERAGFARTDVIQTRMYLPAIARDADAVGRAHAMLFDEVRPAATMLGVAGLVDPAMLVEVEVVAWRPEDDSAA
ncbi:MAG: Rid family hydrolase [Candidatus Nanopelagicales bacterium]|jgi:enamine deaminase RidA (YjgF/YER057c/UK114 family)|nr:Rid family hydrolase [Candidatus Nanopelagicales bacterium]